MPALAAAVLAVVLFFPGQAVLPQAADELPRQEFGPWLDEVVAEARQRGFSDAVIEDALGGLEPLERVVESDRTQAEVTLTFERYYRTRVTAQTVRRGRQLARQYRTLLRRVERTYGVPARLVLAIWGMETRYGRVTGRTPVFQALATLAWEPRRAAFFRGQLFDALTMAAEGSVDVASMTGSWAGAMGQTQFMPSSYLKYAVDFDGDGRRDIWRSIPDTLASIANYLKGYGWNDEQIWGREARVSASVRARIEEAVPPRADGCYAMRDMTERRSLDEWQRLGVRRTDGGRLPRADVPAALATIANRTFLLYPNYDAILGYNCAHHYALSVALLSERLR